MSLTEEMGLLEWSPDADRTRQLLDYSCALGGKEGMEGLPGVPGSCAVYYFLEEHSCGGIDEEAPINNNFKTCTDIAQFLSDLILHSQGRQEEGQKQEESGEGVGEEGQGRAQLPLPEAEGRHGARPPHQEVSAKDADPAGRDCRGVQGRGRVRQTQG